MGNRYSDHITTTYEAPGFAHIKMNDVEGKNCLSHDFVYELMDQVKAVKENDDLRVVVLSGMSSVFCGGADIRTLQQLTEGDIKPVDILLSKDLLDIPVPLISAMEGHAVGGGLALGLCADITVLGEQSRFGCSFMNLGFTPGMGITKLMEHYMTPAIAHELQYTGMMVKGRTFKGKTNFNHIVPNAEVLPLAMELAEAISEKPAHALRALKRYLTMNRRKTFQETYSIESMMHELTFNHEETKNRIEKNYVR